MISHTKTSLKKLSEAIRSSESQDLDQYTEDISTAVTEAIMSRVCYVLVYSEHQSDGGIVAELFSTEGDAAKAADRMIAAGTLDQYNILKVG